ncbi:baculoviral IAP repeat-containing protein 1 isoform B [Alligator mississippiensis]|uniref:Baculoviral IAP repeat-containing protein 1 isoform B n=1 Tax=Alligator mississippiensis TaxID=8496 RepID=A0A151PIM2_ALLMI|nr:baculoviral IAP repeat-containing protein 1 isoform B [Alligator mississippiensis]
MVGLPLGQSGKVAGRWLGVLAVGEGKKYIVQCFACAGLLEKWEEGDDPGKEHAKWFPDCKCSAPLNETLEEPAENKSACQSEQQAAKSETLEAITFLNYGVTDMTLEDPEWSTEAKTLTEHLRQAYMESLEIREGTQTPELLFKNLDKFICLKELSVYAQNDQDVFDIVPSGFRNLHCMERLLINNVRFRNGSSRLVEFIQGFQNLSIFHLNHLDYFDCKPLLAAISSCRNLTEIRLTGSFFRDQDISFFAAALPNFLLLKVLDLDKQWFVDEKASEAFASALGCLVNLEELNLPLGNGIRHAAKLIVQQCPYLPHLRIFSFVHSLNDESLMEIAKVASSGGFQKLENLSLSSNHNVTEAAALSSAGFFFTGEKDKVQCFACGGCLGNWEEGDDPWKEHAKWFPECEFLRHKKSSDEIKQYLHSYCGFVGVVGKHFTTPSIKRILSTETGEGDVQCFACAGCLENWEEGDDPWKEHKKWLPDCKCLELLNEMTVDPPKNQSALHSEQQTAKPTSEGRKCQYSAFTDMTLEDPEWTQEAKALTEHLRQAYMESLEIKEDAKVPELLFTNLDKFTCLKGLSVYVQNGQNVFNIMPSGFGNIHSMERLLIDNVNFSDSSSRLVGFIQGFQNLRVFHLNTSSFLDCDSLLATVSSCKKLMEIRFTGSFMRDRDILSFADILPNFLFLKVLDLNEQYITDEETSQAFASALGCLVNLEELYLPAVYGIKHAAKLIVQQCSHLQLLRCFSFHHSLNDESLLEIVQMFPICLSGFL